MVKRVVDTDFWTDMQVIDNYSVEDKFFALYLMTNGRSSQVGIYSLPKKVISFETGFTTDVIQVLLERFGSKYEEIIYSEKTQEVTLLKSLEYSILKGGKPVLDLLERELGSVKDCNLILKTYEAMQSFWNLSKRKVDKGIEELFEKELSKRGLISIQNEHQTEIQNENQNRNQNENQNEIQNEKQNDNDIHSHNINHNNNHNHNQVSSMTNRGTNRSPGKLEDESKLLESYISYLEGKNLTLKDKINLDNILFYFYKEIIGDPTLQIKEDLNKWSEEFPKSIILEALTRSRDAYKPMNYASKILNNWKQANVKNFQDIMKLDKDYK